MKYLLKKLAAKNTKFIFIEQGTPPSESIETLYPEVAEKVLQLYEKPLTGETWKLNFSLSDGREDTLFVHAINEEEVIIGWGEPGKKTKLHPSSSVTGTHSVFNVEEVLTEMLAQASESYQEAIVMGIAEQETAETGLKDLVTKPLSPEKSAAQAEGLRLDLAVRKAKRQTGRKFEVIVSTDQ